MFIAHLPAGYIASRALPCLRHRRRWVLLGSVLPDADILLIYSGLGPMMHHHFYLTHRPAFWAMLLLVGVVLARSGGVIRAIAAGGLVHMLLDSVTGMIDWGWPFSTLHHPLILVRATQDWWVMSFVLHWSVAIELGITALAAGLFWQERRLQHRRTKHAVTGSA